MNKTRRFCIATSLEHAYRGSEEDRLFPTFNIVCHPFWGVSNRGQDDDTDNGEKNSSTDFVDRLDNDDKWEVLNAQKDISLYLHTQTIRFCQVLLTLIGLVFAGLTVFGPNSIASVFSLGGLTAAQEVIGFWPWLFLLLLALTHLLWAFTKGWYLLFTIGTRLALLGLTVHPFIGDENQTNSEGEKSRWIRANQTIITIAENDLSNAYTNLIWLFFHVLLAVLLYHGAVYQNLGLLYGIIGSMGVVFWVAMKHVLPTDENRRQSLLTTDDRPHRVVWMIFIDLYERSESMADSRFGTWRQIITQARYFLLILPHLIFFLFSLFDTQ